MLSSSRLIQWYTVCLPACLPPCLLKCLSRLQITFHVSLGYWWSSPWCWNLPRAVFPRECYSVSACFSVRVCLHISLCVWVCVCRPKSMIPKLQWALRGAEIATNLADARHYFQSSNFDCVTGWLPFHCLFSVTRSSLVSITRQDNESSHPCPQTNNTVIWMPQWALHTSSSGQPELLKKTRTVE